MMGANISVFAKKGREAFWKIITMRIASPQKL